MDFGDISKFTPEEQAALNYHRSHLVNNTFQKNDDGSMTTFMGSVVDAPNGGAMIIPTYWGSQVREIPDAMRWAIKSGITFPTYPDVKSALQAEKRMHDVMEEDVKTYMESKNAPR